MFLTVSEGFGQEQVVYDIVPLVVLETNWASCMQAGCYHCGKWLFAAVAMSERNNSKEILAPPLHVFKEINVRTNWLPLPSSFNLTAPPTQPVGLCQPHSREVLSPTHDWKYRHRYTQK